MKIDDLTIGEFKQLQAMFVGQPKSDDSHWQIGSGYFIRTVTHHLTGRLVKVTPQELVLEGACWISDDGRFSDALKKEVFEEVEPFPDHSQVIVGRGSLIDAVTIEKLPKSQK